MTKTGFLPEMKSRDKPGLALKIRLLRVGLFAQETRFLWVFSVQLLVYQSGETGFLRSPSNRVSETTPSPETNPKARYPKPII
jgi:hypothetical protein